MGRGRKGPVEQSFKKPKGYFKGEDWTLLRAGKKEKPAPLVLLTEDLLAEMQKIGAQNLMKILLPEK